MQRIILHLDMNSYFASVEQQANPFFRNKPVGVCAYLSDNGCIIASSIEAKKVGIKTGCRVSQAKKLYPKVILVENDPDKYRAVTKKFFKIMNSYSSSFEPYSIDEAFLDLSGFVESFNQAGILANEIHNRIKFEVGSYLKCSIGISFTKFLAKFASDVAEPDSTLVISSKDILHDIYINHQLTDIWGINFRLKKRLNDLGIWTILDLKNVPVQNLIQACGKYGYWLHAHVNGTEIDHLRTPSELKSKSIGHSYCLPKRTVDKKYLSAILLKLVSKVGKRLRDQHQVAYGIYIGWTYALGSGFSKSFKLKKSVFSTDDIFKYTNKILSQTELKDRIMMLAVGVFNLNDPSNQLELFKPLDNSNLIEALDNINSRYGNQVIYKGRMWKTENLAQDRIGFRKVEL